MKEYKIDPQKPEKTAIDAAAVAIKAGKIAAFPTDTIYGLGVSLFNELAIMQVYRVKGRPRTKALIALIADRGELDGLIAEPPPEADRLIGAFWPGALTIIFKARPGLSAAVAGNGTIGVRLPDSVVARAIIKASGPLATTSANLSERPGAIDAGQVGDELRDKIEVLLDGGKAKGVESTVIDVTASPVRILRQGAITAEAVALALKKG